MLAALMVHHATFAAWTPVDTEAGHAAARAYVDLDTVRQSGPMAIYRQVSELTDHALDRAAGLRSIVRTSEYDCMNRRVRVLKETGFSSAQGAGDTVPIPQSHQRQGDWQALAAHPGGARVWALVCPGHDGR